MNSGTVVVEGFEYHQTSQATAINRFLCQSMALIDAHLQIAIKDKRKENCAFCIFFIYIHLQFHVMRKITMIITKSGCKSTKRNEANQKVNFW